MPQHIANDLISKPDRRHLYETGGRLDPDEIKGGMFLVNSIGNIYPVVVRSRPGEKLPREHQYSTDWVDGGWTSRRWTQRDCVCLSMRGAPRGPERVARVYRDVTEEVLDRL